LIVRGREAATHVRAVRSGQYINYTSGAMSPAQYAVLERDYDEYVKMAEGQTPDPSVYAAESQALADAKLAYADAIAAADTESLTVV
jgi:hypothetical protein